MAQAIEERLSFSFETKSAAEDISDRFAHTECSVNAQLK